MKNVILLIIIILAGCSAKPYIVSYAEEFEGSGQNGVYVVSHGWHTGFVIPAPEIQGLYLSWSNDLGIPHILNLVGETKGFIKQRKLP